LGGRIRNGEKSSPVIFWNIGDEQETTAQDGAKATSRPFLLRYYSVFDLS
jgi:antirestriction protein ArdC